MNTKGRGTRALAFLDQLTSGLLADDPETTSTVRELLKQSIDVCDGPKLSLFLAPLEAVILHYQTNPEEFDDQQ